jgi:ribonuclease HI
MDEVFSSWPDISDQPTSHSDVEYFTDGSSFIQEGTCFAGYAMVTLDSVIEAYQLLVGTFAQKTELVTLMRALQLTAGVQVNIYTNSKYASQLFMSMVPYIRKGASLLWRKKYQAYAGNPGTSRCCAGH